MKYLTILLLLFTLNFAHSQLSEKSFYIEGRYLTGNIDTTIYNGGSLGVEYRFNRYIGINYSFDLLYKNNQFRHIHAPMGLIGGPILIIAGFLNGLSVNSTNSSGFGIGAGILLLALPDGVNFHIPIGYKWDLSVNVNVLGIDFVKDRNSNASWIKYACSFGTKGIYSINENFTASIFLETRKTAGYKWGIGGGAGLGVSFGNR